MSKFRSKWINLGDDFQFTGNIEVPSPATGPQAANKAYVDAQIASATSLFKSEEIPYTDTTNKVLQLSDPVDVSTLDLQDDVVVIPIGGTVLDYGVDYTVRSIGSTVYICIDPSSTAPTASFDGGDASNPSVGVNNLVLPGDLIKVMYKTGGTLSPAPDNFNRSWFGL